MQTIIRKFQADFDAHQIIAGGFAFCLKNSRLKLAGVSAFIFLSLTPFFKKGIAPGGEPDQKTGWQPESIRQALLAGNEDIFVQKKRVRLLVNSNIS